MNSYLHTTYSHGALLRFVLIVYLCAFIRPVWANLLWAEEFNQISLNTTTWNYDLGFGPHQNGWGNQELQQYTNNPKNVSIKDGQLIISALKHDDTKHSSDQGIYFTSGRINTEHKFSFQYGTVEARIKIPNLSGGLWPAFWLLGNNFSTIGWPFCGEIDIMEMGHHSAIKDGAINKRVGSTAHWEHNNVHANYGLAYDSPLDLHKDFHLFRLEWTPQLISTFVDSQWIWSIDISNPDDFDGEEFHRPYFFLINLAVGGGYTEIMDSSEITAQFPAHYIIDYIRIYDNGYTKIYQNGKTIKLEE